MINDFSLILATFKDTFTPQSLTATGAGDGILVGNVAGNRMNARLSVGTVTGFTSLDVKMQTTYSDADGNAVAGGWTDITGATFTQVTAASGVPEIITFQLPVSTTYAYTWVRAYATLVGTSVRMAVTILATQKFDNTAGFLATAPTIV